MFGQYTLTERLAVGGMAEVLLASVAGAHGFARTVVIKRLLPHLAHDAHFNAMFIDEAKLTAKMVHPKIAQTYELGRSADVLYIAMEFVDGIDVLALLRECAHHKARVPQEIAVYITHEVLDALDFAHGQVDEVGTSLGVVHRDISPSNVLLSRRGDVKLVDFGIARTGKGQATKAGTLKGKYGYMSPEQVVEVEIDGRSDVFSTAIVLAEMLTGRRLFAAPNELDVLLMVRDAKLSRLDRFGTDIEPDLDAILRRGLKKNAAERYQSAAEFREALGEWMFAKRYRVTPRNLAEIVESLYEGAWLRKREALSAADAAKEVAVQQVAAVGAGAVDLGEIVLDSNAEMDGIPAGDLAVGESLPLLTIEESVRPPAAPQPPRPTPRAHRAAVSRRVTTQSGVPTATHELDLELDDGAPPTELELEHSVRYPSIEAAIGALTPAPAAPAEELDFVDIDLGSDSGSQRVRPPVPSADELAHSKPPLPPVIGEIEEAPDDTGDFVSSPPIAVLYRLTAARATGLLVTSVGGIHKEIYFRDGVPEYVSSNVASELFGSYLISQGVLSEGELAMALAMMPHYGGKLGDTLVGLGLLKPLEVFRHLTRQVRQKLIDVCSWSKGSFAWYGGRENTREAFPLDINPFEVLGAGAQALPSSYVSQWVERIGDQHLRAAKSNRVRPEHFEVTGLRTFYEALDGRRSVRELASRYTDDSERHRALCMLFLLLQTELVKLI